ncbi:MAG: hypothetical protein R3C25_10015 [Hyphomonadaceae bacterium]
MYKLEDTAFLDAWAKDVNPSNASELAKAGRQVLRALAALDEALAPRAADMPPGEADPLSRLIVQHYGPIYTHDVIASDVQRTALNVLGG